MAKAGRSAAQAAQAVNAVLGLSSNDQGTLLEVLEDYFTSPNPESVEELEELDEVDKAGLEGAFLIHIVYLCIIQHYGKQS